MKPIIGMSSRYLLKDNLYSTKAGYVESVLGAGGVPLMLPVLKGNSASALISLVDGLIITGGADISPLLYGEQPHPKVTRTARANDEFEFELIREAIRAKKPIFGICRGIQVLNVYLGGTLYQDIVSQIEHPLCHYQDAAARGEMTHTVSIEPESRLARILGVHTLDVNSYHHQSVKALAPGLKATAFASDGVIEAVENEDGSILGVQWHPEGLFQLEEHHARLFTDFVERCSR